MVSCWNLLKFLTYFQKFNTNFAFVYNLGHIGLKEKKKKKRLKTIKCIIY